MTESATTELPNTLAALTGLTNGVAIERLEAALSGFGHYARAEAYDKVSDLAVETARRLHGVLNLEVKPDAAKAVAHLFDHGNIHSIVVVGRELALPSMFAALLLAKHVMEQRGENIDFEGRRFRVHGITHRSALARAK